MPSGAKKRKAAKKKQNQSSSNPSHGDDVRHQVDTQSHQNTLEAIKEESYKKESFVAGENSVVEVEREFKIDGEFSEKDGKTEREFSGSSRSNSSSSSSSDDESHDVKNSQDVDFEKAEVNVASQGDSSVGSNDIKYISEKNVEERPSSYGDKFGILGSETEVGIVIQPDRIDTAILDQKECVVTENDDRLTISYNPAIATVDNGAEHEKDSGVTQPLLAPDQQPKQTTSWKSCCGLFELFTGSGR